MGIIICGLLLMAVGLFMIVAPKAALKDEAKNSPEFVEKVKKEGVTALGGGVVITLVGLAIRFLV